MCLSKNRVFILLVLGAVLVSSFLTINIAASSQFRNKEKNIVSVYIDHGDSLWGIASRYYTEQNNSMKDYLNEIKECNHLSDDNVRAGQYIIVPYYEKN